MVVVVLAAAHFGKGPQTAPQGSGGGGCGGTTSNPTQGGPGGPQGNGWTW